MAPKAPLITMCLLLGAQQLPTKPTFQSSATLVEVDVVVRDGSGRPVRGLRKEDFAVAEDGTPVEIATFSAIDLPAKTPKAVPAMAPVDALLGSPIQARGLTMRIVAIPAPLESALSAAVIVGIELPSAAAAQAHRVDFTVAAIDDGGKTRARLRFTTNFAPPTAATPAWTHTGSRIDLAPGRYQIRVAAVGADRTQGSVFTALTIPRFNAELGVGGLSLGAPGPAGLDDPDRLRDVLPLVPYATRDFAPTAAIDAQLPIHVSSKMASSAIAVTTTLLRPDGTTIQLDRATPASAAEYAKPSGKVYRVAVPRRLAPGHTGLLSMFRLPGPRSAAKSPFASFRSRQPGCDGRAGVVAHLPSLDVIVANGRSPTRRRDSRSRRARGRAPPTLTAC